MKPETEPQQKSHQARTERSSLGKILLMVIGVISVVLGTIGIFLPLLPTTPFLLLAAACFTRSSDRLHHWLTHHPWFGTYIRNYQEHRAITLSTKLLAIALLWSTITYTTLAVVNSWWIRGPLLAVAVGTTIHLLKLKTLRLEAPRDDARRSGLAGRRDGDACAESGPFTTPDGA